MIKSILMSFALSMSLSSVTFATDLVNDVKIAVEKARGSKCKIDPKEQEVISIYCVNSSGYSSFKISIEDNVVSGQGLAWSQHGDEAECQLEGKVKADNKVKLSIRCQAL